MDSTSTITGHIPTVAPLPAGEYLMGCERGRSDERPVHRVRVDPIAMGITTVTNEQYRFFVGQAGGRMPES
ncbi:MAG: SUMF1/EgtB/PvdO family nonheme iron enzyme, partial [Acidobacteriota bacterium]|nr:SUMF1/EgtB/PvdO family nonheme iron enzyme [Acidobacteriota bacterium]